MLEKLKELEVKYSEIEKRMTQPEYYSDVAAYAKLAKDQKELMSVVETYRRYMKYEKSGERGKEAS